MKKILVITATLGNRESLKRTIDSVKEIGKEDVSHVIVCPEDKIPSIKQEYGNIDCTAEPTEKMGIYAALNHGFQTYGKEFDYLTFINDDDYWLPDFRILIDKIKEGKSDLVYGKTRYVDSHGKTIGRQASSGNFKSFVPLLYHNIILLTQQATIIKSDWYFKLQGFDESYRLVADTKFWAKLSLEKIKYRYFNLECAAYMIQEGQLSSDHHVQNTEHQRLLKELPPISSYNKEIAKARFRITNLNVYIKRLFSHKSIRNPFRGVKYLN